MNELRPCAPISLKHVLAQELINGLRAVSNSLLRYNASRMLRENESLLFLSLCRAFIEVNIPSNLSSLFNFAQTLFSEFCPRRLLIHTVPLALAAATQAELLSSWTQRTCTTELAAYWQFPPQENSPNQ